MRTNFDLMNKNIFLTSTLLCGLFISTPSQALTYALPSAPNNVVGEIREAVVEPGDDFHTLARRYDMGYYQLIEANPGIDPDHPRAWSKIIIPSKFVLPNTAHHGIVINLAELRLYYYPPKQNIVMTFPIGIGREGWSTPVGSAKILTKKKDPTWTVPPSILKDAQEKGQPLPAAIPPGPENPLGRYAMRLSIPSYLIHGTNYPDGVGMRSSAGCIRMYPEDVEKLFQQVNIGTPVQIVNDAYKAGWSNDRVYLEAHLPLQEQQKDYDSSSEPLVKVVNDAMGQQKVDIDWIKAHNIADAQRGIPATISRSATNMEIPITAPKTDELTATESEDSTIVIGEKI